MMPFVDGGFWMGMWMLVFWVALVLLVVWVVRTLSDGKSSPKESRAMAILEERFARGEIDRDEFEQRRSALEGR